MPKTQLDFESTMACNEERHKECRATLRFLDPRDYDDPEYPIFLCQCKCHGGLLGAIMDNYMRERDQFGKESLYE